MLEAVSQHPVLIIDAANLFLRSYAAFPSMGADGQQMGGCIGFLKTLRKLTAELQPQAVYIAWEAGGSQRRRSLYSEYKMNRRPEKLNRFYEDDLPESDDNKKHQMRTLLSMLKNVPVCQVYVSDCEGDDIIAYICKGHARDVPKVIASSDKDMLQLLDDKTKVYSFHKKTYVGAADVLETFRVSADNFAVAKALCGDPGDNVPGIKGLGFKKVAKLFPFLGTDNDVSLDDVFKFCHSHSDKSVIYRRVLECEQDVKRNWKLVYLDGGMLSATQASKVDHVINTFEPKSNRMGFTKHLVKEGIGDFDVDMFFYTFRCITNADMVGKESK